MIFGKLLLPVMIGTLLFGSSGSSLYNKSCKSCHGAKGDQLAMGKSKAIKGMPVKTIENAMVEYASGKRKSLPLIKNMKSDFMKKHSKEELHSLAKYINKL